MRTHLQRSLLGGAALGMLEVALVLASGRELFLSAIELARYAALAASSLSVLVFALGILGHAVLGRLAPGEAWGSRAHLRRAQLAALLLALPACMLVLLALSSGRRVRALPGRWLIVMLVAVAAACALARLLQTAIRSASAGRDSLRAACAAWSAAFVTLALDMHVLHRLYPAFHLALEGAAVGLTLYAASRVPVPQAARTLRPALVWACAAMLGFVSGASLRALARPSNVRFAIAETAPLSGRLLRMTRMRDPLATSPPAHASAAAGVATTQAGIDLRQRDVLLITIDALRADRLRAYGGHGLTPALDALAAESVVFLRAYTPTPHTSYALSSLMTGKFMQPLMALGDATQDHPTLPRLLRRNGYRTAAFYPPAIFFVDGERFEWLERDQLGFEYAKAMFASAAERVPQLERYLREVEPGHPLFVWVHLFEPHEPYEPPPEFARGDAPLARYEGEVAAADASVGQLIAAFRKARPNATVIASADHGEEFGEHGGHHHGTTLYDEQVRVPLVWSSPGSTRPGTVTAPVEIVDIATTLLAALGIPRDARMRGDDLGPLLRGADNGAELRAFASIDGARMWCDGSLKLICGDDCRLFDLVHDPSERRDVSEARPEDVARLRGELRAFVASLPRIEALAMSGGSAWPAALTRARLGDRGAGPELLPLLASPRDDVRAATALAVADLQLESARTVLARMRTNDADAAVRREAAVAALRLGEEAALEQVRGLFRDSAASDEQKAQAALALAARGDASGEAVLCARAADTARDEGARLEAIRALASLGDRAASAALVPLLGEVRLRPAVAAALGRVGDAAAVQALSRTLAVERYPIARTAEAQALFALGARREALREVRRFLGTESGLPDALALLLDAGALRAPSGEGADLRTAASVRRGPWQCEPQGCRPLPGATLVLPALGAPRGRARVALRALVAGEGRGLRVAGVEHALNPPASEVTLGVEHARALTLELEAGEGVLLEAVAVVPESADVPPPPPEPWAAGTTDRSADEEPPPVSTGAVRRSGN